MLSKIENLNKKIDALMKEKTKADAQKEVWENRLLESIKGYKQEYGVDLSAQNVTGIKENLGAEISKVEAKTKEEYEKANRIVGLIQAGDIKGAWKELGVDLDAIEARVEEVEPVKEVKEVQEEHGLQGIATAVMDVEEDDFNEADLFGMGAFVVGEPEKKPESKKATSFMMDDDDDEDDFVMQPVKAEAKPEKKVSSFMMDDDDEDEFVMQPVKSAPKEEKKVTSFMMDDDDDDDDFGGFGGFGGVLAGSPFEPKKK